MTESSGPPEFKWHWRLFLALPVLGAIVGFVVGILLYGGLVNGLLLTVIGVFLAIVLVKTIFRFGGPDDARWNGGRARKW